VDACIVISLLIGLVIACGLIVTWRWASDPRALAQIVERLMPVGARVSIASSSVSLFGGATIDGVRVTLDQADLPVLTIESIRVQGPLSDLAAGRVDRLGVVARGVDVYLVEDLPSGRWNVQSLASPRSGESTPERPGTKSLMLPRMQLDDARIHRLTRRDGKTQTTAVLAVEGEVETADSGVLAFSARTLLGGNEGPRLVGSFDPQAGGLELSVTRVDLDELTPLLPDVVLRVWERFAPSGRIDAPSIRVEGTSVRVELQLENVAASLPVSADATDARRIPLDDLDGTVVFERDRMTIERLAAKIGQAGIVIDGRVEQFDRAATFDLHIATPPDSPARLSTDCTWPGQLPEPLLKLFNRFKPSGEFEMDFRVTRVASDAPIQSMGRLDFQDAGFVFEHFVYPVDRATGSVVIHPEPTGGTRLELDVTGKGARASANRDARVRIEGFMSPLERYAQVDLRIEGDRVVLDEQLVKALPKQAGEILRRFEAPGGGRLIDAGGTFKTRVIRQAGVASTWSFDTDVSIRHARGFLRDFPWPIENATAELAYRRDGFEVRTARLEHAGGVVEVAGVCPLPLDKPFDLALLASNVPVDQGLLDAIPPTAARELTELQLTGMIDCEGSVTLGTDGRVADVNLDLSLRNATLRPKPSLLVEGASGQATLRLDQLQLASLDGTIAGRGVSGSGLVDWRADRRLDLVLHAPQLLLDENIRASLGPDALWWYDRFRPEGSVDLTLMLTGDLDAPTLNATISPTGLSIRPAPIEAALAVTSGRLDVSDETVTISSVNLEHAGGVLVVEGSVVGEQGEVHAWTESIDAAGPVATGLLELGGLTPNPFKAGKLGLDLRRVAWIGRGESRQVAIEAQARLVGVTADHTLSVTDVNGLVNVTAQALGTVPQSLSLGLVQTSATIAGVGLSDARAQGLYDAKSRLLRFDDLVANVAGGTLGGSAVSESLADGSRRTTVRLLGRSMDLTTVPATRNVISSGIADTSLDLEWLKRGEAPARLRGRGEISLRGRDIVKVPVVVGLTQLVTLALPFAGNFDRASASYLIDDNRIDVRDITLSSAQMQVRGSGTIDMLTREIDLSFYTQTRGASLPVIGQLLDAARKELFNVRIRGKLEDIRTETGTFQTIGTTIDQVLGE
jgi:hypothetical protein